MAKHIEQKFCRCWQNKHRQN